MLRVLVAGVPFEPGFAAGDLPIPLRRAFDLDEAPAVARAKGPGLFSAGDQVAIVLPRCFERARDDAERLAAAGHTLRVLRRYIDEKSTQRAIAESDLRIAPALHGDVKSLLARLESMLLLWDDYRAQGPVAIATRRLSADARGRIHWPRTIAATVPMVSHLDVLYPDPIRTRHALDPEHPITRLHIDTAEAAGHFLGARSSRTAARVPAAATALALLDRHERALFQDRQRHVATLLRRYHDPSHRPAPGGAREVTGVFATSFPHVWERMLFVALGSHELPVLPEGRYVLADGHRSAHATSFRLDLLLAAQWRGEDVHLVVDAKDYEPGTLPVGDSVNKQLLYRLLLARKLGVEISKVGNAFVGPAVVPEPEGIRLHAVHDLAGTEADVAPLGRIVSLEVDFGRVAAAYARGGADEEMRGAVTEIVMSAMRRRAVKERHA